MPGYPRRLAKGDQAFRKFIEGHEEQNETKNAGEADVRRDSEDKWSKIVPLKAYRQSRKNVG